MPLSITGPTGELRHGYHSAATLASWSIDYDAQGVGTLKAAVISQDAYRVTQAPLTFVVSRPTGAPWKWLLHSLQITGGSLSAMLNPEGA